MTVEEIRYRSFRNIEDQYLSLSPEVNILYGENAQGKTNALEGIYLFAHGKSFRTQNDRDMVAFGANCARLDMVFKDDKRKRELSFELYKTKRRVCKINHSPSKLSEIIGLFRAVLFCPDHLSIVKDGPACRRSFINGAVCQLNPVYLKSLQRYNHIVEQRNSLLKQMREKPGKYGDIIDVYATELAREAAYIYLTRRRYIDLLCERVELFFDQMSTNEKVSLRYKNSLKKYDGCDTKEISEKYRELFITDIKKEIELGSTLHGVHKDDLEIYISGKEARLYASQGQQRSIALALKLAEGEISKEETGNYPVFLFDDVLSELDKNRQSFVLERLENRQVIITSCDKSGFGEDMVRKANLIYVKNGNLGEV